jgi:isochorismate hydrolase
MKKEAYFLSETIKEKAAEMMEACLDYRNRHANQVFSPQKAALLVLDMQTYFLNPRSHAFVPSSQAVLPAVQELVEAFYRIGRPVVFTQHANNPSNARMMEIWWKDLLRPGSPEWDVYGGLETTKGIFLSKSQYDAFMETELEKILAKSGSEQVVITGVMTHLCCETTARSAFMRGFRVFFPVDATATYTEAFHRASLLNLSHGFAVPVTACEILEACNG